VVLVFAKNSGFTVSLSGCVVGNMKNDPFADVWCDKIRVKVTYILRMWCEEVALKVALKVILNEGEYCKKSWRFAGF